jgi:hypothetical protein
MPPVAGPTDLCGSILPVTQGVIRMAFPWISRQELALSHSHMSQHIRPRLLCFHTGSGLASPTSVFLKTKMNKTLIFPFKRAYFFAFFSLVLMLTENGKSEKAAKLCCTPTCIPGKSFGKNEGGRRYHFVQLQPGYSK